MFTGDLPAFILRFLLADFFAYHRNLLILPKNCKVIVLLVILIQVAMFSFHYSDEQVPSIKKEICYILGAAIFCLLRSPINTLLLRRYRISDKTPNILNPQIKDYDIHNIQPVRAPTLQQKNHLAVILKGIINRIWRWK